MIEKYKSMLNLNAKIHVQKPKLAFGDKHSTNFLLASMPFIYEGILNNFNTCNMLKLEETVYALCIKKTELINFAVIKEESAHFAIKKRFRKDQKRQREARIYTISQTANRGYIIQSYFLRPTINYFYCKKDGHG